MIKNAEKCVFLDEGKVLRSPENAIHDALLSLPEGKMLVYRTGRMRDIYNGAKEQEKTDDIFKAARLAAGRLKLSLVQWPNEPASAGTDRNWCYAIQKPAA